MAREALRRVVLQLPDVTVAWMANDGAEAVERAKVDRPDLVLMDLIMPVRDGVESIRLIMRDAPCPILVVTATVEGNASRVYEAIGAGAGGSEYGMPMPDSTPDAELPAPYAEPPRAHRRVTSW